MFYPWSVYNSLFSVYVWTNLILNKKFIQYKYYFLNKSNKKKLFEVIENKKFTNAQQQQSMKQIIL